MPRQRHAVGPESLAPAPELVAVGDVQRPGALLDGAVQIGDPDLQYVERHRLGERVHLLVDHRAPVRGGSVGDPVDRQGGEVDQPERRGRRRGIGAHGIDQVAQQPGHPGPEAAVGRDVDPPE